LHGSNPSHCAPQLLTLTYRPRRALSDTERPTPHTLLAPAALALCAQERSLSWPCNHALVGPLRRCQDSHDKGLCLSGLAWQIWLIDDSSASARTHAISGLFVAQPTCTPSAPTITRAKVWRRRLFMRRPSVGGRPDRKGSWCQTIRMWIGHCSSLSTRDGLVQNNS
jgi:hypothetical protein